MEDLRAACSILVRRAVILVADADGQASTRSERDWLWSAFHVPVFEQYVTSGGKLVAWECEAHDGLHLAAPRRSRHTHRVQSECACGNPGPRIAGHALP